MLPDEQGGRRSVGKNPLIIMEDELHRRKSAVAERRNSEQKRDSSKTSATDIEMYMVADGAVRSDEDDVELGEDGTLPPTDMELPHWTARLYGYYKEAWTNDPSAELEGNQRTWRRMSFIPCVILVLFFGFIHPVIATIVRPQEGSVYKIAILCYWIVFLLGRWPLYLRGQKVVMSCISSILEKPVVSITLGVLFAIGVLILVVSDVVIKNDPLRLVSLGGLLLFILGSYIFSIHRKQVKWRPVLMGLGCQFALGMLVMRTSFGLTVFGEIGNQTTEFLNFVNVGASFVFGDKYTDHFFAFKVIPTVIFFSSFISICYYLGLVQAVVIVLAKFLSSVMGTSASESLNAAANIFVGQTEAPLLIKPFLADMTKSEIHAVMVTPQTLTKYNQHKTAHITPHKSTCNNIKHKKKHTLQT